MLRSQKLNFDLELNFLRNPYLCMSSTCIQNFTKIDKRKLWKIPSFIYEIEFTPLRSIYSISFFYNTCFE